MTDIESKLNKIVQKALKDLNISPSDVFFEHPTDVSHGDFSTNVAMVLAKKENKNPKELAKSILEKLDRVEDIEKAEIAGPGFINFYLSKKFYSKTLKDILESDKGWGRNESQKDKKIMVEYTDPNPFKAFHIGHLMNNTIGESISRIIEFSGTDIIRANYQGDVGPHVAKAIWGIQRGDGDIDSAEGLGKAYATGATAYEEDENAKAEINAINKSIYSKDDKTINELYKKGRKISLDHFEELYKILGTQFDQYFFESEVWEDGVKIVKKHVGQVYEESEGAIIFRGENYDNKLHTRVFINSEGLPTYEAKEIGLAYKKVEREKFDTSITITAEEQKEYFKVVMKSLEQFNEELENKIEHITHGMLKLSTGKMSSRTGDVVTGESLLASVKDRVLSIMEERDISDKEEAVEMIAIAAIKYSVLRQAANKDIVYDLEKSLSFEGDSGPYLQYAHTRAQAILSKVKTKRIVKDNDKKTSLLEKLLYRFPEIVEHAKSENEPHHITTYLTELAGAFNSFYAAEKIIGGDNEKYNLALTKAFKITMKNGLYLLGIKTPKKM